MQLGGRSRILVVGGLVLAVLGVWAWARGPKPVLGRMSQPRLPTLELAEFAGDLVWAFAPEPTPTPPVEPPTREDECEFLGNGDYVCAGPVSVPRCGLTAVDLESDTAAEVVRGALEWADAPALTDMLGIEGTAVVVGVGSTTVELGEPTDSERPGWHLTVDLFETRVTLRSEPSFPLGIDFDVSRCMQVFGRKRGRESVAILVVHCHWPTANANAITDAAEP